MFANIWRLYLLVLALIAGSLVYFMASQASYQDRFFVLKDVSGAEHRLESFRGRRVLLHFWATWCEPCQKELPDLLEYARTEQDRLEVFLISLDSEWKDLEEHLPDSLPPNVVSLLDPKGIVADRFRCQQFPTSIFLNADLTIERWLKGPQKWLSEHSSST